MIMLPTSSTTVSQKIKSRQLAQHMRFGSPKLRDVLRQKCKIRIKESRISTFDCERRLFGLDSEKTLVDSVIKEELKELNYDIQLQEIIYKELREEASQWTFNDLSQEETEYLSAYADSSVEPFFCLICQKAVMSVSFGHIYCTECNIKFRCTDSIDHFQYTVQRKLLEHEHHCDRNPNFFAEPIGGTDLLLVNMFCDSCDFFAVLN